MNKRQTMIQTTDNTSKSIELKKFKVKFTNGFLTNLRDYQKQSNCQILSFTNDIDILGKRNQDDLIIDVKKVTHIDGDKDVINFSAQTGNYVGEFVWNTITIKIESRFSVVFLKRMLNFANDVYFNDMDVSSEKNKNRTDDLAKFILFYLFIQALEKAYLLGLPKAYKSIHYHDPKVRGKIDINSYIKHDIPFMGKISSVSREQHEIQEIVDVLHKAVDIVKKSDKFSTQNIDRIKSHLKEARSNHRVTNATIKTAKSSKALLNPIFSPYRKVLNYAEIIIKTFGLKEQATGDQPFYGFIVNVAELFEIYVFKLLQRHFPEWEVTSPKIDLYPKPLFYARKIIPDIVMLRGNDVLVFDTKYKAMNYVEKNNNGLGDLDRSDFFQIHTYMAYYQQKGFNLIGGGLLYPLSSDLHETICHADSWFGDGDAKFIVDGIRVEKDDTKELMKEDAYMEKLMQHENDFIGRIKKLIAV